MSNKFRRNFDLLGRVIGAASAEDLCGPRGSLSKLIDRRVFGLWSLTGRHTSSKAVLPSLTKAAVMDGRRRSLTKTRMVQAVMASSPEEMLWYSNFCPAIGDCRFALMMLDIDAHEEQTLSDSESVATDLIGLLQPESWYQKPSTGGRGVHIWILSSWFHYRQRGDIREDMNALGRSLGQLSLSRGYSTPCREVKGAPLTGYGSEMMRYPTWARVPVAYNTNDGELLSTALMLPTPFSALKQRVEAALPSSPTLPSSPRRSINSPLSLDPAGGSTPSGVEVPLGEARAVATSTLRGQANVEANISKLHPMSRMLKTAWAMRRQEKRNPTLEELLQWYESLGLGTGKAEPDRSVRARHAIEQLPSRHRWRITEKDILQRETELPDWSEAELTYSQKRGLKKQRVAFVSLILDHAATAGMDVGQSYVLQASREFSKRCSLALRIDNKQFAKATSMLQSSGWFIRTRKGVKGGGASHWVFGGGHPKTSGRTTAVTTGNG